MKLLTTLLLAIACITTYAQTDTKRCEFSTDGTGKSLGLKVKFQYPCGWEERKPKTSIKVLQIETEDEIALVEQIDITTPKQPLTPERIEEMMTVDDMKKQASKGGKFLWGRRLKIDGKDCAEVATQESQSVLGIQLIIYVITYRIPHNGKMVSMSFAFTGRDEAACKKYFNDNKALILSLASATKFL